MLSGTGLHHHPPASCKAYWERSPSAECKRPLCWPVCMHPLLRADPHLHTITQCQPVSVNSTYCVQPLSPMQSLLCAAALLGANTHCVRPLSFLCLQGILCADPCQHGNAHCVSLLFVQCLLYAAPVQGANSHCMQTTACIQSLRAHPTAYKHPCVDVSLQARPAVCRAPPAYKHLQRVDTLTCANATVCRH